MTLTSDEAAEPEINTDRPKRRLSRLAGRDWGRGFANLVTLAVAGDAGYLSWRHLNELGVAELHDPTSAFFTPFAIDGMIVVGTLQLRSARRGGHPAHWSAYACVILGVVATVAGNVASAPATGWARILSGLPPVAFLLSIEALFGKPLTLTVWEWLRTHRPHRRPAPVLTATEARPAAKPAAKPAERPAAKAPVAPKLPVTPEPPAFTSAFEWTPATAKAPEADRTEAERVAAESTNVMPVRLVDGERLAGPRLRDHGIALAISMIRSGQRVSGGIIADAYSPPMSRRWGLDRLVEARAATEAAGDPSPVG